jgi:mRNA deadenylase 3'-5' endonuclease subunit Ccr4
MNNLRVLTYNLLSQELLTHDRFPKVKYFHKDFTFRVNKTKELLKTWMKVNFIICLQELSEQWKEELTQTFVDNSYTIVSCEYTQILGVCICFPNKHYELLHTDIFQCSNYVKEIYNKLDTKTPVYNDLKCASVSKNKLLSILLNCKSRGQSIQQNIIVSTYHMPCMFMKHYYIMSHIHAIKQHLDNLLFEMDILYAFNGSTESVIFSGDLNITPDTPEYNLLLNNETKGQNILAECYQNVGYNLYAGLPLISAHKLIHNTEPHYTNVSVQHNKHFVECIDYILITTNINVRSCLVGLVSNDPITRPYPNALCPSDHLPLSSSLMI